MATAKSKVKNKVANKLKSKSKPPANKKSIKAKSAKPVKVKVASTKASTIKSKAVTKKASSPKASSTKSKTSKTKAVKTAAPTKTIKTKTTVSKTTTTKPNLKKSSKPVSIKATTTKKGTAWLHPLDDRLLIELVEEPQVSPGGIILIDSTQQPENLQGVVLAVGRGHQNKKGRIRPIETKAGDKVIFSKFSGDKITQNGVNFVIIRESEILGYADKTTN